MNVEADISRGLHAFSIVGLPDKAVDEAKDRVGGAIKNSGFKSPKAKNEKVVISLSPADLKKEGPSFDLPIALAYLLAAKEISFNPEGKLFLGELALDGQVRAIRGVLPLTQEAVKNNFNEIFVPVENAKEAALVEGIKVYGVPNLSKLISHLEGEQVEAGQAYTIKPNQKTVIDFETERNILDFADVRGQEGAKRGLEIAAAGGHNIAMYGSPGTGKTMLARAFAGILPELELADILEITGIHSIVGANQGDLVIAPPFRSPHHTSSYVSIIGGGAYPKPGEVTLAHKGVLFLDEFPEFDKRVLESLRQPLEDNVVSISRARGSALFPSNFILVAAMNPCPCGHLGSKQKACVCKPADLDRYKRKLSGPIMDRIDLWISVGNLDYKKLGEAGSDGEPSQTIKQRVLRARQKQQQRFEKLGRNIKTNSDMNVRDISNFINLSEEVRNTLDQSAERLQLSPRAYHRVIKLARTIADLANEAEITTDHILEAIQYRPKVSW